MYVYFIQIGETGFVKIGKTTNVEKRMIALQTANPEKLRLLYTLDLTKERGHGTKTIEEMTDIAEKHIHMIFRHTRMEGEWFKPTRFMMDYIEYIKRNGFWTDNVDSPFLMGEMKELHDNFWSWTNKIRSAISKALEYGDYYFAREMIDELVYLHNIFSKKKIAEDCKYLALPWEGKDGQDKV